jgi:hypothetical protein
MAPKVPQQKGKGAASGGVAASAPLPKGSWEGSWVKERRIELLRQRWVIPSEDLVRCCPSGGERVPAPELGEVVVFFERFEGVSCCPPATSCGSSSITSIYSRITLGQAR